MFRYLYLCVTPLVILSTDNIVSAQSRSKPTTPAQLTIDAARIVSSVSPMLYGLMTEEINHSYEGGLYAEMVQNRTFQFVFQELLDAFNFTVTEDTPLNQEVAVDPEMLGKVFESIVLHAEQADPDATAPG